MDDVVGLKKEIAKLKEQRKWLHTLLEYSYEWMGTCGCTKQTTALKGPEHVWSDKTANVLNFIENEELNGR